MTMSPVVLVSRRVRLEQKIFWRNPQASLFMVLLPVALLVILGYLNKNDHVPHSQLREVVLLAPGILTFGLIGTNYGNIATTLTSLRDRGVLKRLRATPMPPGVFIAGQIGSTLIVSVIVAAAVTTCGWVLFGIHLALGAAPAFVLALLVGSACFCALGLAVTGFIASTEAAGPVTNATYIPLAIVSGLFAPTDSQPGWLTKITDVFPVRHFAEALQRPFASPHDPVGWVDLAVLAVWGVAASVIAVRYFRWTSIKG